MKPKVFACTLLAVVVGAALAASPSWARGATRPTLRLGDRVVSVGAPEFSAAAVRGQVRGQLAVRVNNLGRRSLAVAASDFAVSAQGDIFRVRAWHGARPRVKIRPQHARVVRLSFALPRSARAHLSLYYRATDSNRGGSIPLDGAASPTRGAFSSASALNTFWTTAGVGEPWGTAVDRAGNVWFA